MIIHLCTDGKFDLFYLLAIVDCEHKCANLHLSLFFESFWILSMYLSIVNLPINLLSDIYLYSIYRSPIIYISSINLLLQSRLYFSIIYVYNLLIYHLFLIYLLSLLPTIYHYNLSSIYWSIYVWKFWFIFIKCLKHKNSLSKRPIIPAVWADRRGKVTQWFELEHHSPSPQTLRLCQSSPLKPPSGGSKGGGIGIIGT